MKHLLIGMFILVVAFPLCLLGGMWLGYGMARVSEWSLWNTSSVRAVMPPLNTTTIVKDQSRLACDGRG